jgi:hypothetical protein
MARRRSRRNVRHGSADGRRRRLPEGITTALWQSRKATDLTTGEPLCLNLQAEAIGANVENTTWMKCAARHLHTCARSPLVGVLPAGDKLTAERVALTAAKRRIAERQDQIEAGQVAQVEPIRALPSSALLAMRNRLLNLPGELAFVVAGRDQAEAFEAIDSGVREALEEISSPDFPARAAAAGLEAVKGEPRNNRSI